MQALRTRYAVTRELAEVQDRISTGLRVSSVKDDGARYSIARGIRSELAGWGVIQDSLARGEAITAVASEGVRNISDNLLLIREQLMRLAGAQTADERAIITTDIQDLVAQNDRIARASGFQGVNLLTAPTGPTPQPSSFSLPLPTNPGSGAFSFSRDAGATVGRLSLTLDLFSASDIVEIWKDGARVAATGRPYVAGGGPVGAGQPATFAQTLSFDYTPGPSQTVDFRFNQAAPGSGWRIDGLSMTYPAGSGGAGGSGYKVLSNPQGDTVDLGTRSMLAADLGIEALTTDPIDVSLARITAAITTASKAATYFGAQQNALAEQSDFAGVLSLNLQSGLGNLVDADLAQEHARLQSLQVRDRLSVETLSLAGAQTRFFLDLFKPLGTGQG